MGFLQILHYSFLKKVLNPVLTKPFPFTLICHYHNQGIKVTDNLVV